MARCPHGFELTAVACVQCPRSPLPSKNQFCRGKVEDITGQTLAGATVLSRADNNKHGTVHWHCVLRCGHSKTIAGVHLRQQHKLGGRIRCAEGCSINKRTTDTNDDNRIEGTNARR